MKKLEQAALLMSMASLASAGISDRVPMIHRVRRMKSMDPEYRTKNRRKKAKRKAQKAARRRNR